MDFDPKLMATIGTSFITSLAAKGITGPAETINDLWKVSFGYPIHYFSEKRRIKYEINLQKFEKELTNKILEIPKENVQEPKESIIGPALEASKYYFDEEEIRELFANLIASSMDSTYNGLVQHSFVEIIKQLSPYDAKLFSCFDFREPYITRVYVDKNKMHHYEGYVDKLFIDDDFPDYYLNQISLENLIRLGLIKIEEGTSLNNTSLYEKYESLGNLCSELKLVYGQYNCIKKYLEITALGKVFKEVCIKDSL